MAWEVTGTTGTMTKLKGTLWNILQNLTGEEFKQFQWFLKQDDILEGFPAIPEARLERADRQDTVDQMVQQHGCEAIKITLKILEQIGRNDQVQRLSSTSLGLKDVESKDVFLLKLKHDRKKAELGKTDAEIKLLIREREMKICEITRSAELSGKCADRQTADSVQAFTALKKSIETSLDRLTEAIEDKRRTTQKQADGLIKDLEQEISELTKRSGEVERLSQIQDHHIFLQSFANLSAIPPTKNWTEISVPPPSYGQCVGSTVNRLRQDVSNELERVIARAKLNRVKQFAVDVTLDPDTANPHLILSDDRRQVYCGNVKKNLPDALKRFDSSVNVLGEQSFSSGRFYYEVWVKGKTDWDLGLVKESINRKGSIKPTPEAGYWTICLRKGDKYKAVGCHLSVKSPLNKVGVFVDYDEGSVAFYNVDSTDIIHQFTDCSFNEKLYPFFSPSLHHNGENSTPLIISPVNYNDYN